MATPPRSSPRGGYLSQQHHPQPQGPEHGSPNRSGSYYQHPKGYMQGSSLPHHYGRGHGGSHGPSPSQQGERPSSSRGKRPGNPPGPAQPQPQSQQSSENGHGGGSSGYGPSQGMYGSGLSGAPPPHMYNHGQPQSQPFQYSTHGGSSPYGSYPPYGYPPHGYGPPPGYHQYPMQQHGSGGSFDDLQYKSSKSGKGNPDKGSPVGKGKKSTSSSVPLSTPGRSPAKTSSETSNSPKDEANSSPRPKLEDSRDEDDEEEDILADKVNPMRSDFHFYALVHRSDHFEPACKAIKKQLKNSVKDDDFDPYLIMSNLNERLIKAWEQEPSSVRTTYMKNEEEDRKRFMTEDEIASRHCATLTARAKSPKAPGSRSSPVRDKKNCGSYSEDEAEGDEEQSKDHKLSHDKKHSSLDKGKQEGRRQIAVKDESGEEEDSVDDNSESPTKKLKPGESEEPLVPSAADRQTSFGKIAPSSSKFFCDESKSIAKYLDAKSHIKEDPGEALLISEEANLRKKDSETPDEKKYACETSALENDNTVKNEGRREGKIMKKVSKNGNDEPGRSRVAEKLLDRRIFTIKGKRVKEYLVRWKGFGKDCDSWEPLQMVSHLEDQVNAVDEIKRKEIEYPSSPRTCSQEKITANSPSQSLRFRR